MGKKSIKKNYIYNVSYQILLILTPIITAPYLARVLGPDGVGTASYIDSIVSYFVLFATMGMTTFGQREISYLQDDKEKRSCAFWEINILEVITASIAIVLYLVFAINQKNSDLYLVLIFNIISVVANVTWFFQGMEEFGKIVFRNVIFKIINIAYIFLFVKNREDLIVYMFGLAFFGFLSNVSLWFYLPQYVSAPSWKELRPFRHIKDIISLFIPTVAIQIYIVLDKTMLGAITKDSFENGYYDQAMKISKIALTLVTALGTVMIPRIGHHFEKGETEEVRKLMYRGYRFVWFLGIPLCLGLVAISSNLVPWFLGAEYEKSIDLLKILSFLIIAIGISNVTGMQYLLPTKRQKIFTVTVVSGAITNLILNFILIRMFQSYGATISSIIAEIVVTIVQLYVVRKEINPFQVLKEGGCYYIAGVIMFAVVYFLANFMTPSILHTMLLVMSGGIVYLGLLFVFKDEFMLNNVHAITNKFIGRNK